VPEDRFLALLDADAAIATTKYEELFHKLVRYFEWRRCRPPHPEDLAQETLRRGFTKMAGGADIYAEHPGGYFFGIAQNVLLEHWKRERRTSVPVDDSGLTAHDDIRDVDTRLYLDQCLAALNLSDRNLLISYFTGDRKRLSGDLQVSPGGLRVRVYRVLEKVRNHIQAAKTTVK
jgi:DNA-directed RNA polymerase specialized sigma24 family protein